MPYVDIWSMLLSGQVLHRSNSSNLFWNLEDPVLVQTASYRKKITYHLYVAFTCSSTAAISTCTCELSLLPMKKDPELNRQFPFGINLNKILPDLLKLRIKAEKPGIQVLKHT